MFDLFRPYLFAISKYEKAEKNSFPYAFFVKHELKGYKGKHLDPRRDKHHHGNVTTVRYIIN
jgi:hypothetical protein